MNKTLYCTPVLAAAALAGCSPTAEDVRKENEKTRAQGLEVKSAIASFNVRVWTDPDTGREYVIVNGGNSLAITPRLPKE